MVEARKKWKYDLLSGVMSAFARLPLGVLYLFSDALYLFLYKIGGYRRRVVKDNLHRVFPGMMPRERLRIERGFYHHLCDCMVEAVKLLHISDAEADRRIEVCNAGLVDSLAEDNHSVFIFLGHYGNWEWVPAIMGHFSVPDLGGQIYKPLSDKVMNELMLKIRSRFGTISIPQDDALRTMLAIKRDGKRAVVGFISDQRPNSSNLYNWTEFLGQETAFTVGTERIGRKIGARYVYLDVEKLSRGHYRLTFKPMDISGREGEEYPYTLEFLRMLEETIRRAPHLWLWSHKRWSVSRKPTDYRAARVEPEDMRQEEKQ